MIKNPASINTTSAKKVLITGGAGFLGSHLTEKLLSTGNEVSK
jgi:nucleoside-diphosphate-sugar epimerase